MRSCPVELHAEFEWDTAQHELNSSLDSLQELGIAERMAQALLSVLKQDREKLQAQRDSLRQKMESLRSFAEIIDEFAKVLNQYMLLHLPDLKLADATFKQWVSHDEATAAHRMLEACRDAISEEKVLRRLKASMASPRLANSSESNASYEVLSDHENAFICARLFGRDDASSTPSLS